MRVPKKEWDAYISKLSSINKTASDLVSQYADSNGLDEVKPLVDYSYKIAQKYGNASASLNALMYDTIAELEGKILPPAELAPLPEYGDVAKAVYGTLKTSQNTDEIGGAVGRLVKMTGQDTMLKNAIRDKAEFAWVPNGDSCPFCLALASRGWQRISKKALKNGHAEHIHSNCDCTYMIRHSDDFEVAGYDPNKYLAMYEGAEGNTPREKINSMRRMQEAKTTSRSVADEGNSIIARLYDEMRTQGGFNLLPSKELLAEDNRFFVSFPADKISDEAAKAFNDAFERLDSKYISSIQKIEPMAKEEAMLLKSVPADVSIDYDVSNTGVLKYNPLWMSDENKLKNRVAQAVTDKHFVEVAEKDYINYVAVHESAHTLLANLDNIPKTSLVGGDYTKQRAAQKEINSIFDEFKKDLGEKKSVAEKLELEALTSFDQNIWDKASKAREEYDKIFLSKYSEENAGEFMAECFVNSEIGIKPNPYAKRVVEVLDKYFSK